MDDQVNDALLNREIESLLAAEPSPEFQARVRARVSAETPHRSWLGWQFSVGLATLGVAVIVVTAVWLSNQDASPGSEQARFPVERQVPAVPRSDEPERVASAPVRESPRPHITDPVRRATDAVAADRLVAVVNEEDGKAFDAFLATIRRGDVVLTFNESPDPAPAASPLVIAPIAIVPLPDVLEGGVE